MSEENPYSREGSKRAYDVLIVGAGPAGATAALRAARHGLRVAMLEKSRHPRFHVGESLLPRMTMLTRELNLDPWLRDVPQTYKLGASFAMGDDDEATDYPFTLGLIDAPTNTLNVERAGFDRALAAAAVAEGVALYEDAEVRRIERLDADGVQLTARVGGEDRTFAGRLLFDATGQSTLVGRHLGTRERLRDLERVAYFSHFEGVARRPGDLAGFPQIVMCREGWFWLIPIDAERMSVGLVMAASIAKQTGVPAKEMLAWGIANCPFVRERMRDATGVEGNHVIADFSYRCRPYAGPGYFLVGDAATFIDPIFSTGVSFGMMTGVQAADLARAVIAGRPAAHAQRDYRRYIDRSSATFFRLVRGYYHHAFRELFLSGEGPFELHRAIMSVLCGHVFPRPVWALRWRLRLFNAFIVLQRFVPVAPRRKEFSLLDYASSSRDAGDAPLRASMSTLE